MTEPVLTCLDMEGVLVPEIWIAVAEKLGVSELKATTRDIPDYDDLMKRRLKILNDHGIRLTDIKHVVVGMEPLDGATEFLAWLRKRCQVIILSDTYYEFIGSFMRQLDYPTIFSHSLEVDDSGFIKNYRFRQRDQKRHAVTSFKNLAFRVLAVGDSYNDISMLKEAHTGVLFRPPDSFSSEFPFFSVTHSYAELKEQLERAGNLIA